MKGMADSAATVRPGAADAAPAGIAVSDASPALLDAIGRLLALLDTRGDAAALAAGVEREILWRLPFGAKVDPIHTPRWLPAWRPRRVTATPRFATPVRVAMEGHRTGRTLAALQLILCSDPALDVGGASPAHSRDV